MRGPPNTPLPPPPFSFGRLCQEGRRFSLSFSLTCPTPRRRARTAGGRAVLVGTPVRRQRTTFPGHWPHPSSATVWPCLPQASAPCPVRFTTWHPLAIKGLQYCRLSCHLPIPPSITPTLPLLQASRVRAILARSVSSPAIHPG